MTMQAAKWIQIFRNQLVRSMVKAEVSHITAGVRMIQGSHWMATGRQL